MRTGGPDGLFNKHSAVYDDGFKPAMAWQCLLNQGSILARVAVKVMNTLVNSVPSERSFSAISFIHTKARNRLTPVHADMQAFIFMNDRVLDRLKDEKYAHKKRWADLEEKDWLELEDSYLELFVNAQGKKVWMDGAMASTNEDFEWEGVLQSTGDILGVGTEVESEEGEICHITTLDNETRWNSWAIEVAVALSKRKEINSWQEDHHSELGEDRLEFKDWQELQLVDEFLQPFLSATKGTEGEESSLDDMLMSMDFLIEHFKLQKEKHKNNPQMTTRILASWFKFDKYYQLTDDSPIYAAAILLNPALRRAYLDSAWSHQTAYIEPAVEQAREMWTQSFKPMVTTTTEEALAAIKDPFQRFRAKATGFVSIKDEFDDFINANPHPIGSQSPLEWWLEPSRRALYPNLQQMAVTVFAIPPMSAGPERVFSGTRHTIAPERARLGAKMVEMTECVKSWVHIRPGRARAVLSGVFRNSQHADDALGVLQEDSHREEASEAETSVSVTETDTKLGFSFNTFLSITAWWLRDEQKERFPRLSKMAIDILSIPAMSADPERTFSGARRSISWDRMLFGASTIERGECLKSWIRSGITAGLQVEELEQYEHMAKEDSTVATGEDFDL
ncbi:transposase [Pochonia chlamydosporia 170]|uniref:Transposase n=1 Tax=Pochonia chlamydosporia 170 TaxID=1380566 RepID=A0A219ANL5_METCM|nr:transposase [Pochonia chlamydosporia 170]OWT42311.1 transposase [Pochonia chlamydosporia 170]